MLTFIVLSVLYLRAADDMSLQMTSMVSLCQSPDVTLLLSGSNHVLIGSLLIE